LVIRIIGFVGLVMTADLILGKRVPLRDTFKRRDRSERQS
jgi:hypothetical protein